MRRRFALILAAATALLGGVAAPAASGTPSRVRAVSLDGDLVALAPTSEGDGVETLLERGWPDYPTILSDRIAPSGITSSTPRLELPARADVHGAQVFPGGGSVVAYDAEGDGLIGNELRGVVDDGAGHRVEQRLNDMNTQASALRNSIAVGPTGTIAVPFMEEVVPYPADFRSDYVVAVRPAGTASFLAPQAIFPHGAQGYDLMDARTYLGPDGGGWVFLLPSGDDWRAGEPVVVLARRIAPDGRLGVLLHLPVPISRPVNTNVSIAASFDHAGRLLAAFSSSGYVHDQEHAVVWTQTFTDATATIPRRTMVVDRQGGYEQYDNLDLQRDATGRPVLIAPTHGGLRLFRTRDGRWTPGARITTTRHTWNARLVHLGNGRVAAIWLQPYNRSEDRSNLMVSTGRVTDRRWSAHLVRGLGRPGLVRLDALTTYADQGIAAAIYQRDECVVLIPSASGST